MTTTKKKVSSPKTRVKKARVEVEWKGVSEDGTKINRAVLERIDALLRENRRLEEELRLLRDDQNRRLGTM